MLLCAVHVECVLRIAVELHSGSLVHKAGFNELFNRLGDAAHWSSWSVMPGTFKPYSDPY